MKSTINNYLQEENLKYVTLVDESDRAIYKLDMELEQGTCDLIVEVREENEAVFIFTNLPLKIPAPKRDKVSRFLMMVNYRLIIGNFELDYDDGEVRYKSSYAYDDTLPITKDFFMRHFFLGIKMMNVFLPGIMTVTYGNISPEAALNQINQSPADPSLN